MNPVEPLALTVEPRRADGPQLTLLDGGDETFPRMLTAIGAARASVHLEVYAFSLDAVGARFIEALSGAARRGVEVDVVIDGFGALLSGREVERVLRAAGCRATIYNPVGALFTGRLMRNHRKLLVIDDEVAFLGGINIGRAYASAGGRPGWSDLAIELRGPPAAWLGRWVRREPRGPLRGHVRLHMSRGGGGKLRRRYLKAFGAATSEIVLAHAYFLPDRRLLRSLTAACRRGVDVKLLLPGRSDVPLVRAGILRLYRPLLDAGARIFEWHESVLHAKVAVIDGRRLLLGSFNLDPLSLANQETLVEVEDEPAVLQALAWLEARIARARPIGAARSLATGFRAWALELAGLLVTRMVGWLARALTPRIPERLRPRALSTAARAGRTRASPAIHEPSTPGR